MQTRLGILMLLATWMADCTTAVSHFLFNTANVPYVSFMHFHTTSVLAFIMKCPLPPRLSPVFQFLEPSLHYHLLLFHLSLESFMYSVFHCQVLPSLLPYPVLTYRYPLFLESLMYSVLASIAKCSNFPCLCES